MDDFRDQWSEKLARTDARIEAVTRDELAARRLEAFKQSQTFNFQAAHQEIEFPEELQCVKDAELLMCNYPPSSLTALRPYEGRIYRLK